MNFHAAANKPNVNVVLSAIERLLRSDNPTLTRVLPSTFTHRA